ncbi:MAG: hypothetical protein RMH74_03165 [Candidatus Caldarchaeum sp.]|nr:hypothetical protein [Candidatus Caldarchaeum sp.]
MMWSRIKLLSVTVNEMNSVDRMMERVENSLTELMRNFIVVLDCTSGTRPAGIAFYALAEKHRLPLVYVYKDRQVVYWLKSRDDLRKEIGL